MLRSGTWTGGSWPYCTQVQSYYTRKILPLLQKVALQWEDSPNTLLDISRDEEIPSEAHLSSDELLEKCQADLHVYDAMRLADTDLRNFFFASIMRAYRAYGANELEFALFKRKLRAWMKDKWNWAYTRVE